MPLRSTRVLSAPLEAVLRLVYQPGPGLKLQLASTALEGRWRLMLITEVYFNDHKVSALLHLFKENNQTQ